MSRRRTPVLLAALAPLLLGVASLLLASRFEAPQRSPDERRFVIPQGTGERAAAGQPVDDILPQWITTAVGVALVVENRDDMRHVFGPFMLDPGQQWRREFATSGEFGFDCSLYPVAGFTIAVDEAPARDAARGSRALAHLWLGAAILLAAALAGALGMMTATGAESGLLLSVLAAALPGTFAAAVASGLLALSRLAAWRPVLGSSVALVGVVTAIIALAIAVAVLRLLPPGRRATPERSLPPMLLTVVATVGLTFSTLPADLAVRMGLLGLGGGLLAAALWSQHRWSQHSSEQTAALTRVAWIGFSAVLVALPLPLSDLSPPWHAALSLPGLVLGTTVLTWGARQAAAAWPDGGWLPRVVGGSLTFFAAAMLWWAGLRHLGAVSLPLWGNPTASSSASIARGAGLWRQECAACHEDPRAVLDSSDRALLEIITHGQGEMPGLAYRLELRERGDIVNYLRRLREDNESSVGLGEPLGDRP
jgi:mono/diheme cytochrome c family protein